MKISIKLIKWFKKLIFLALFLFISFLMLDWLNPLPINDFQKRSFAQVVVDKDGEPLRAFPDSQGVWRYPIGLSQVSPLYLEALINYEDRYYYQHFGINPLAVIRAFGQWVWNGELVSGASTLTMQVARILKPHKRTFSGKVIQMFRALQLEWHYDKDQILNYYINYAPFGGTIEGVQAASYAYFGKTASELTYSEAALLAVMPQSPSRFRPDRYPQRAQQARDKLLQRLLKYNIWDKQTIDEAKDEQVWAQYNTQPMIAPLLTRRLAKQYPQNQVIKSTIDIELQLQLESLLKSYIETKSDKLSAAILMIDNSDMTVKAYLGSADFLSHNRSGHVDMIQAVRSPGSTLKPFIYAMGIDEGLIHSESLLFDVPQTFNGYRPKNFTDSFHGAVSVSNALGRSLNMPAVQILNEISPESFYARMKNAGLKIQLPNKAKPNLTLALGGGGIELQELVGLFSSLGRKGQTAKIRLSHDQKLKNHPFLSEGSAWIVQNILAQVPMRTLRSHSLISEPSIAYKTGTSYGFRDAWVLASNKRLTLGIWVGQADGSFLENNSGRQSAVPLLQQVMAMLPKKWHEKVDKPFNVNQQSICWPLGNKSSSQTKMDCHKIRSAFLLEDTAPPTINNPLSTGFTSGLLTIQTEKKTGKRVLPDCWSGEIMTKKYAVWPKILEPWIAKPYRRESFLPKFSDKCAIIQSSTKLEITGIHNNATIYPMASSKQMPEVQLKLQGSSGENFWYVNGVLQNSSSNELILSDLKPNNYKVTVVDNSANYAEIKFVVKF